MKFIINNINKKKTVIFIQGFLKSANDFNMRESGTKISIEDRISNKYNTIRMEFDPNDYMRPISDITDDIIREIKNLMETEILIVSHSRGSFNALDLAKTNPKVFNKLLLIDPTIKNSSYKQELSKGINNIEKSIVDIIHEYMLKTFDSLPEVTDLKPNIIIQTYINFNTQLMSHPEYYLTLANKIKLLNKITNKNTKSKIIIQPDIGHMIHYFIPDKIINSINELLL
jgi:pimeloyl-ACP methyl ester carboxylesterase